VQRCPDAEHAGERRSASNDGENREADASHRADRRIDRKVQGGGSRRDDRGQRGSPAKRLPRDWLKATDRVPAAPSEDKYEAGGGAEADGKNAPDHERSVVKRAMLIGIGPQPQATRGGGERGNDSKGPSSITMP
jgi:hypothetical protein